MILLLPLNHEKWFHVAFQSESQALNVAYWILCSLVPPYTSAISHASLTLSLLLCSSLELSHRTLRWWLSEYEYFVIV